MFVQILFHILLRIAQYLAADDAVHSLERLGGIHHIYLLNDNLYLLVGDGLLNGSTDGYCGMAVHQILASEPRP